MLGIIHVLLGKKNIIFQEFDKCRLAIYSSIYYYYCTIAQLSFSWIVGPLFGISIISTSLFPLSLLVTGFSFALLNFLIANLIFFNFRALIHQNPNSPFLSDSLSLRFRFQSLVAEALPWQSVHSRWNTLLVRTTPFDRLFRFYFFSFYLN